MVDQNVVDEAVKKLNSHKGVVGTIICNGEGIPIRSSMGQEDTVQYTGLMTTLVLKARRLIRTLPVARRPAEEDDLGIEHDHDHHAAQEEQELEVIRLRSEKHEVIITPEFNSKKMDFILIVVQDPSVV
ncbi:unnamed protein product [Pedinophyceae sp. YPF-701]|nr:unnamed protein product [Pedinophyceae sp. YPF-701]